MFIASGTKKGTHQVYHGVVTTERRVVLGCGFPAKPYSTSAIFSSLYSLIVNPLIDYLDPVGIAESELWISASANPLTIPTVSNLITIAFESHL